MSRWLSDRATLWVLRIVAAIVAAITLSIVLFLTLESTAALGNIGLTRFLSDKSWHPSNDLYNLTPMVFGTALVTMGAIFIATPLGVLSAIFCHCYAPATLAAVYRRTIELLGGVPSVVYGFWGLVVLVPLIGKLQPPGTSLLAGILILALMILPTISLLANAALSSVPKHYITSAAALGMSRWAIVRHVTLPIARNGLVTSILLAVGRAIGETMAVLMVCGNVVKVPDSLFAPVRTLTANIALEMSYALGNHRSALFVTGLVLISVLIVIVTIADKHSRFSQEYAQ